MTPTATVSPRHRFVTVYGRTPVLDVVRDERLEIDKVMVAEGARGGHVEEIVAAARQRNIPVLRAAPHRIKKLAGNGRHDQGVLADVVAPRMRVLAEVLAEPTTVRRLRRVLLVDGVTTPANLGMILRSATAAGMDAVVIPRRGVAAIDPLVVKSSAGAAFRAPVVHCATAAEGVAALAQAGLRIMGLRAGAEVSLFEADLSGPLVLVVGNESTGISPDVARHVSTWVGIPLHAGVESLNVAAATAVACFEVTRR